MTTLKNIARQLNVVHEAKRYGVPLWQSPQFLFVVMGIIIIISTFISYLLGVRYIGDILTAVLLILGLAGMQLIIAFVITRSFERLIEAARLKAEFVSVVSHQLRSPLTNLKWALDFLRSGKSAGNREKEEDYLQILNDNTLRMQELINDLLITSRLEQGRLPFHNQEFSFDDLIKSVVEDFQPFIQASNIALEIKKEDGLPPIFSDPTKIYQTIANLLDNAIRYTKKSGGKTEEQARISIQYHRKGSKLYFEIEDNGIGIPQEDQKYIFQKFFRSKNASRVQTRGSGLGLHIAKSIIEKAGGAFGFRSQEYKGSTFWFTLSFR